MDNLLGTMGQRYIKVRIKKESKRVNLGGKEGKIIVPSSQPRDVVSGRRGDGDSLDNLQVLCKAHHSLKTVREDGRWGAC